MSSYHTRKKYKYCIVPGCRSTTTSTTGKYFIRLPTDKKKRNLWQQAMRRHVLLSEKTGAYCCQDHFNLEEDAANYVKFKLFPNVKIKLKEGVVPRFFDCQTGRIGEQANSSRSAERQEIIKGLLMNDQQKPKVKLEANAEADMPEENLKLLTNNYDTKHLITHKSFFECQTGRKGEQSSSLSAESQEIIQGLSMDQKKPKVKLEADEEADMPEDNLKVLTNNFNTEHPTKHFKSISVQARPSLKSKLIQCGLLKPSKKDKVPYLKSSEIVESIFPSSLSDNSGS